MNEFKKPFEYTEEKRGLILVFVLMLLSIDILFALFYTVQVYIFLMRFPAVGISFLVLSILYILFIPTTAMTCYSFKKCMISITKLYLLIRAVFTICCITILYVKNINDNVVGIGKRYSSYTELTTVVLLAPLLYVLTFSIGWYLYFTKSKRCKELINSAAGSNRQS